MKKIILLIVAIFLILGNGCSASFGAPYSYTKTPISHKIAAKQIPIYIDKEFSANDKLSIDDAISQWRYSLNGYIDLSVVSYSFDMEPSILQKIMSGEGFMILKINSSSSFVHDYSGYKELAQTDDIGGHVMYIVRDRLNQDQIKNIVLHEFGHLLGAKHDPESWLMRPMYSEYYYRCIDKRSAILVATYQHIPAGDMNYCYY